MSLVASWQRSCSPSTGLPALGRGATSSAPYRCCNAARLHADSTHLLSAKQAYDLRCQCIADAS